MYFTQISYSLNRTKIIFQHHENLYNSEGVFLQGTVLAESLENTEITATICSCNVTAATLVQFAKGSEWKCYCFSEEA